MKKTILIILTASFFLFAGAKLIQAASLNCVSAQGGHCVNLSAIVSVPGLDFIKYDDSNGLGGLIASLYNVLLGLVGVSAFLVILFAAFQYITAGDNETRTSSAKKKIKGALLGILLAFTSWLILHTINPGILGSGDNLGKVRVDEPISNNDIAEERERERERALEGPGNPIFEEGQSGRVLTGNQQENQANSRPGDIISLPGGRYVAE